MINNDVDADGFRCVVPVIFMIEYFSSTPFCSPKNSASEKSNFFLRSAFFPTVQEATRGGGSLSENTVTGQF